MKVKFFLDNRIYVMRNRRDNQLFACSKYKAGGESGKFCALKKRKKELAGYFIANFLQVGVIPWKIVFSHPPGVPPKLNRA